MAPTLSSAGGIGKASTTLGSAVSGDGSALDRLEVNQEHENLAVDDPLLLRIGG